MCGLAGVARRVPHGTDVPLEMLGRMSAALRHRGPDGSGHYSDAQVGLAHVRLSIIDVAGGAQPLGNEDDSVQIVYNGEVYNYLELAAELSAAGHRFRTRCDTEVLVHAYEQWGIGMLSRLNGQFAFAIYDRRSRTVFLARDRFGVRPLFVSVSNGTLFFASEVKALFASGEVDAALDPIGLDQVFTFWAARPPRTVFQNVQSLEPGTYAIWRDGELRHGRFYDLDYPEARDEAPSDLDTLDTLLGSSVALRLRSDVPVGGYLSGGLDSSITCALAARQSPFALRTFSVTFDDPQLDESAFQRVVADQLHSKHHIRAIGSADIAAVFPDVVRHAETPLVRTAPAPMYLLARLAREHDIKVVLTGEGSDELFLGYDLFKETALRLFCLRQPQSRIRPRLFDRLYPYLDAQARRGDFWRRAFLDAGPPDDPLFSHLPRFQLTSRIKEFYSADMKATLAGTDAMDELRASLPPAFAAWSPLNRAAYLEMVTLLSPYLLSSQGDRMSLAHGVEARYPFLDPRVYEYAARLPTTSKLRGGGLREKAILRRWTEARNIVPPAVQQRPKQPYRAPDIPAFFAPASPDYVADVLEGSNIARTGLFEPAAVQGLVRRCRSGAATGFRESQALVAILSTELWHRQFISEARLEPSTVEAGGA
ncbi:MAG TPA: asparagine synthase (glutamine-hydrolyzing) [Gemmatimonadales bacterium]|nr:asparagine synthase (glutamine-hydrolyzing) [Gemmatimonadales bacterium]